MIKPVTMYSVVCDRCGKTFCEGDTIITGADKKSARGYALESRWLEIGDKHYCPNCCKCNDIKSSLSNVEHGDNRGRVKRMELIVEPYGALPCELETFTINGKAADSSDFGDTFDHNEKRHYGCGDMRFEPQSPTKEVLAKYNITEEEYNKICDELEDKLCVGSCGWCV